MLGPLSQDMSYVLLKEFQCSYLGTEDGGDTGGFKHKIPAAKRAGVI
jgi:Precorrin-6x reductase